MKIPKNFQRVLLSSIAAAAAALFVADSRIKRDPRKLLEKAVGEAVEKWKNRLSLSREQAEELRKKLTDSAYRKNEVLASRISRGEKDEQLKELQKTEDNELKEIFTDPQYDLYRHILEEEGKR